MYTRGERELEHPDITHALIWGDCEEGQGNSLHSCAGQGEQLYAQREPLYSREAIEREGAADYDDKHSRFCGKCGEFLTEAEYKIDPLDYCNSCIIEEVLSDAQDGDYASQCAVLSFSYYCYETELCEELGKFLREYYQNEL
jgi:hypothetical protein